MENQKEGVNPIVKMGAIAAAIASIITLTDSVGFTHIVHKGDPPPATRVETVAAINESPEEVLAKLTIDNETASQMIDSPQKTTKLLEIEKKISAIDNQKDYRFKYERLKNRIYGEKHIEAFGLLRDATFIAIDNNQAALMYDRIDNDKKSVLSKLAHGHSNLWNLILSALKENSKIPLRNYDDILAKQLHDH